MPHQEALTVIAPIRPGEVEAAKGVLGTIPDHVDGWDIIPFDKVPRLHFARLAVFDEAKDLTGAAISAQLALMTNVDGPVDAHLNDLVRIASPGLDAVFGACAGYPDESQRTPATRLRFLRRYPQVRDGFLRAGDAGESHAHGARVDGAGRSFRRDGLLIAGPAGGVVSDDGQAQRRGAGDHQSRTRTAG